MLTRAEIDHAATRIAPHIRQTPCLTVEGAEFGRPGPLHLKLELLQCTGSFKPRGAFNRMLEATLPEAGVIAASGGNHGAAVAYAARALGVTAEIFVPERTPATKRARIEAYGARLTCIGATYAEALEASRLRQAQTGAVEVHAFDHPAVLAGQGTVGREFDAQVAGLTHVLVAVGGGGLIGGIAGWFQDGVEVVAVEPEGCPGLHRALQAGRPVAAPVGGMAADSLGARQVGAGMFEVAQRHIHHSVLVTDAAILAAQRALWSSLRLIAEPGGAAALAALHSGAWRAPAGARVGVVVCGANTDPAAIAAP